MKALTIMQPWATLIAIGAKRIETRSWKTSYRGPLAIHAAKGFPGWARQFTTEPVVYEAVRIFGAGKPKHFPAYPTGAIVAIGQLVNCIPTIYGIHGKHNGQPTIALPGVDNIGPTEYAFGDYSPGRYAWVLAKVMMLREPIPAKGAQGLWEWELLPMCEECGVPLTGCACG